jgi:hypothetical protein
MAAQATLRLDLQGLQQETDRQCTDLKVKQQQGDRDLNTKFTEMVRSVREDLSHELGTHEMTLSTTKDTLETMVYEEVTARTGTGQHHLTLSILSPV